MIRLHEPRHNDASNSSSRRWPFAELHRLLTAESTRHRDAGARRVLVSGVDCGELVTWLRALGLEVVLADRQELPDSNRVREMVSLVSFDETVRELRADPQNDAGFELVFAVDPNSAQSNLLDISSRARTARLLSQLRPSGRLLVLSPREARPSRPLSLVTDSDFASERSFTGGHDVACWVRHLACFPGKLQTTRVHSFLPSRSVWSWMFGASDQPDDRDQLSSSIVSLQIPAEPVTAAAWQDHVRRGLLTGSVCCESAALAMTQQRRVA